ncbi:MAG: hypothetical protein ACYTGF_12775, partial [Planctomycetota bacterium]
MHRSHAVSAGICAALVLVTAPRAPAATTAAPEQVQLGVSVDSGPVRNATGMRGVIYTAVVRAPDAP